VDGKEDVVDIGHREVL